MEKKWERVVFEGSNNLEKIKELTNLPTFPKTKNLEKKGYKIATIRVEESTGEAWFYKS
jgi:hypothetical protein